MQPIYNVSIKNKSLMEFFHQFSNEKFPLGRENFSALLLCHNVGQEEVICMFTPFVLGN
jgi:hypothetical protein